MFTRMKILLMLFLVTISRVQLIEAEDAVEPEEVQSEPSLSEPLEESLINAEGGDNSTDLLSLEPANSTDLLVEVNETEVANTTVVNETKADCVVRNLTEGELPTVRLVNSSGIQEYLDSTLPNVTQSECAIVLFYYPFCVFSVRSAPHFNALGRIFPQLHVLALDAYANNGINMRFGLVGVPSILFLFNGKVIAKYNDSDPSLEGFVSFVHKVSGLSPASSPILIEEDYNGPVPCSPQVTLDYVLTLSWLFVIGCFAYLFGKSAMFKGIVQSLVNTWREAEAQHQHVD